MYHKPWERQAGESAPAFYAFALYRDIGPTRGLRQVSDRLAAEAAEGVDRSTEGDGAPGRANFRLIVHAPGEIPTDTGPKPAKQHSSHVREWSSKWGWVDRAAAWDNEVDRIVRKAHLNEIQMMARRQAQQCQAAAAASMVPVARFLQRQATIREDTDRLDRIPIEELMVYAIDAGKNLPKLHEGERAARCIRRRDMLADDGTVTTEWEIFERRPDRPDPVLDLEARDETDPL